MRQVNPLKRGKRCDEFLISPRFSLRWVAAEVMRPSFVTSALLYARQASSHIEQGYASRGKATQGSGKITPASLPCKPFSVCPIATHQPFARKGSASSRVLKHNCALSLVLARYAGVPSQTCVSRRTPQHRTMSFGGLSSDVHPGLAQNPLSHGAKTLIQSDRFRPNLSQRFLRPSIRPNLTYGDIRVNSRPLAVHSDSGCSGYSVVINSSCCFVSFVVESFLPGFVAKYASHDAGNFGKLPPSKPPCSGNIGLYRAMSGNALELVLPSGNIRKFLPAQLCYFVCSCAEMFRENSGNHSLFPPCESCSFSRLRPVVSGGHSSRFAVHASHPHLDKATIFKKLNKPNQGSPTIHFPQHAIAKVPIVAVSGQFVVNLSARVPLPHAIPPICHCQHPNLIWLLPELFQQSRPSIDLIMKHILALVCFVWFSACLQAAEAPLRVFIRAGAKTHGPGQHDHPSFLRDWKDLLNERGLKADGGMKFPTAAQLENTDVVVVFAADGMNIVGQDRANFEKFLKRGGGLVVLHDGVVSADQHEWAKKVQGGAWIWPKSAPGMTATKWYEGEVGVYFVDTTHPITRGISNFDWKDEVYFDLDMAPDVKVLATSFHSVFNIAPQLWTYEKTWEGGSIPYRAFVSSPGHEYVSFNTPHYRAILLRGIAWVGKRENVDGFCKPEELASLTYPAGGPTAPTKAAQKITVDPEFDIRLVSA
ncbi:MAG: hypothetical protein JWM16_4879, partial [Verrucomicrobiales bacterium]|nr:hypothetical protein [Verrucomicrobiales bacterium]